MDGRGTLRGKRLARTWSVQTWQAIAFFLAAMLALTNAAWFHSTRVIQAEAAQASKQASLQARPVEQRREPEPVETAAIPAPVVLLPGDRCIGGEHVRKVGDTWRTIGDC